MSRLSALDITPVFSDSNGLHNPTHVCIGIRFFVIPSATKDIPLRQIKLVLGICQALGILNDSLFASNRIEVIALSNILHGKRGPVVGGKQVGGVFCEGTKLERARDQWP